MRASRGAGPLSRREVLVSGATAAAFTIIRPELVRGSQANSAIALGMIGCGGRGNWIANLFSKTGKYRLAACADYFQDRVDAYGEKYKVAPDRRFTTLSGYKRLLDADLDAVAIESPPYFHPQQAADAVEAGKHVFLSKPIAVDVPGCQSVAVSGQKATRKKLVFLVDFQTRADDTYREVLRRVHDGAIGRLISAEARYPWSGNVADVPTPNPEDRLRSWYGVRALSGDVIVEQDIHAIDVATWFAAADPGSAVGSGGKVARKHGNIYDHFAVIFQFPDDLTVTFNSQKAVPGALDEIRCIVYGTEGTADTDYVGEVCIRGKSPFPGARMQNLFGRGAERNIDDFYDAVTSGDVENPTVAPSVRSNLASVLGRTAAYRRREVTWSDLLAENETLEFDTTGLKS